MYLVIVLKDGKRTEFGRYDSPAEFRDEHPAVPCCMVGYVIYVHEELK